MDLTSLAEEASAIGPANWTRSTANSRQCVTDMTAVIMASHNGSDTLAALYQKATRNQWSVEDIDWEGELDPENPLQMHDITIPLATTPIWTKMDEKERALVRKNVQAWHISQILHGERFSMVGVGKILLESEDAEEKSCVALQGADEARHVEVYTRLLAKIGPEVPVSESVDRLFYNIITDNEPGFTSLGMQIITEGLALAFFKSLVAYSKSPLVRTVIERVIRDEARHFAAGQLSLARLHGQLTSSELRRREEFVVEACALLDTYLFADELWEPLGLKKQECMELTRSSPVNRSMHRALFRSIVPAVRSVGLLGPQASATFEKMGVLDYAAFPAT